MLKKNKSLKNKKNLIFIFVLSLCASVFFTYSIYKEIKNRFFDLSIRMPNYTVVFDANGGTGTMNNQQFTYGTSQNLNANSFTNGNYGFAGWNTETDGSGDSYTDEESVNNLSGTDGDTVRLYAQWGNRNINVSYDANGGTTPSFATKTISLDDSYGEMPTTTKEGYTLLGWSLNKIPDEYQELDYIQLNTGSYINTGIIPNNHTAEVIFDFDTYKSDEVLFGTNHNYNYYHFTAYSNMYYWGNGHDGHGGTWSTGKHHLIYNSGSNNEVILDDTLLDSGNTITSSSNLYIGKRDGNAIFSGKIYYFKITDKSTGNVVRELIPCYRKSDNEVGLYDVANQNFYYNSSNSGTIEKGNNIEYIDESTDITKFEDHTLYAAWRENIVISYDSNGGTTPSFQSKILAKNATKYGEMPTTTKEGYTLLGWSKYKLPIEYQELDYIQFNTGNYINTGIVPNNHTAEVIFDFDTYNSGEVLFGTSQNYYYYHFTAYSNMYYWGNYRDGHGGTWTTGKHHLIYNSEISNRVILDKKILDSGNTITSSSNLFIGKRDGDAIFTGKIYYFKITDKSTGNVVREFIPCYRKSDNEVGLYDLVNNTFYTNSGSGQSLTRGNRIEYIDASTDITDFKSHTLYAIWKQNVVISYDANEGTTPSFQTKTIPGNETKYGEMPTTTNAKHTSLGWSLNKVPSAYQEVEYIQFNSGTYIDTGIIPTNHETEIMFSFDEYLHNEYLFGTASGTNYYSFRGASNQYYWGLNNSSSNAGTWTTGKHTLIYNGENNIVKLDDIILGSGSTITSSTNLIIGKTDTSSNFSGKVYYIKITDKSTGNIVRYLVPCYRRSDKVIGLYDSVTGAFYPNSDPKALQKFTKGNDIEYINELTELKYETNHTIYNYWIYNPLVSFNANGGNVVASSQRVTYNDVYGNLPTPTGTQTFKNWKLSKNFIPDEYQEVEYIRFNSGNYINTGVIPIDHYTEVKFDFEAYQYQDSLFGISSTYSSYYQFRTLNDKYIAYNNDEISNWTKGIHLLKYNDEKNEVKLDNNLIVSNQRLYNNGNSIIIGKSGSNTLEGVIYYFKIVNKRTDEVERYFIPCYRKSDNEIGMYDLVQNKFYPNDGTGSFEKGENVDYITSESIVNKAEDHTLYAVWEKPKYIVNITVNNGTSDASSKQVYENSNPQFTLSTNLSTYVSNVSCTNGQKATILNDVLTLKDVTNDTTCTVDYSNAGNTVLYQDGTLIINEKPEDSTNNIALHGSVTNTYNAFSNTRNYVFNSASDALWYNERNNIKSIEIGQKISPLSTAYWFKDLNYVSNGDFTNLDTSRVTTMNSMFYNTGKNSSVNTSFILTGLDDWDTSEVTTMAYMFSNAGYYATTWSIGDLTNWNTIKVDAMNNMFNYAGYNASVSFDNIGTIETYATNLSTMFTNSRYMKASINILNKFVSSYSDIFTSSATQQGSQITVNYDCSVENIFEIIATKSNDSNVDTGSSMGVCRASIEVKAGRSDVGEKNGIANQNLEFTITPDKIGSTPAIKCSNNQTTTISGNTLTINNINLNTSCVVYYEDVTVLYQDGSLIINESDNNRTTNQTLHGNVLYLYEPLSNENNYVFTNQNQVPWINERGIITNVEIGQSIYPTSTSYWFYEVNNLSSGNFTNLDTSNVINMSYMFYDAGNNPTLNSFVLTGLDDWDTSEVTTMSAMFYCAGICAKTWSIGDLSNWNTEKVNNMRYMFYHAARTASTSMTSIGTLDIYATNLYDMFYQSHYMKATLNIYSNPPSGSNGYSEMLSESALKPGSLIIVNYSSATTNIDDIIATKSSSSNVVKGIQLD